MFLNLGHRNRKIAEKKSYDRSLGWRIHLSCRENKKPLLLLLSKILGVRRADSSRDFNDTCMARVRKFAYAKKCFDRRVWRVLSLYTYLSCFQKAQIPPWGCIPFFYCFEGRIIDGVTPKCTTKHRQFRFQLDLGPNWDINR